MHKNIADKWVQALRSGDYKQGEKALKINGTHCCLGVLCDLHKQECGGEWYDATGPDRIPGAQGYRTPSGDWDWSMLPEPVQEWAGIRTGINPGVNGEPLSGLNDGGWKFGRIADLIDARWEDL